MNYKLTNIRKFFLTLALVNGHALMKLIFLASVSGHVGFYAGGGTVVFLCLACAVLVALSVWMRHRYSALRKRMQQELGCTRAGLARAEAELEELKLQLAETGKALREAEARLGRSRTESENTEDELDRVRRELESVKSRKYISGPSGIKVESSDDALMKKALELVERNMDNSEYDVDAFVSDMAIGRTVLYGKVKECTGMSIHEFILDIRLKRACQLVCGSSFTISEISFMTGFTNPKYFSVCFKRRFGLTPSGYREKYASDGIPE